MNNEISSNISQQIIDLINQGQQPEAIKIANKFVEQQPDNSDAYYCRGQAKISWGHTNEAVDDIKKAISLEPSNADYYNLLGMAYMEKDECEIAIQEFNRAIHIDNNNLSYKANLSKADALLGNVESAAIQLEELYSLDPNNGQIKNDLVAAYIFAATNSWFYSEEDGNMYAISIEDIKTAENYAKKIKSLSPLKETTTKSLQDLNELIKASKSRRFTGGWGTLVIVLLFSIIMFSTGGFLMGVTGILYYFSLRTPQYISAKLYFSNEDDRNFIDRIISLFVTDGMMFFGTGIVDSFVAMWKANFIMSIIRLFLRISFLPITVAIGFFKNYSKYYGFAYIGTMIAFIVIMNFVNAPLENLNKNIIKNPVQVLENIGVNK